MSELWKERTEWRWYLPPVCRHKPPHYAEPKYPVIDGKPETLRCPVIVAVDSAAALAHAREIKQQNGDYPVVIWSWQAPEVVNLDAEKSFPVVYGIFTHDHIESAVNNATNQGTSTASLLEAERAFGFNQGWEYPTDYDYQKPES